MSDSIYDSKMKKNPYAAWGWDYDGGFGDIDSDIDMKGHGIVNMRDPVDNKDAATKEYVDAAVAAGPGGGGSITAQNVSLTTPAGMAATTAQEGFDELADRAAFKDTPNTFTEAQTIGNAVISEVPAVVPYAAPYASPTGKVTQISTQNSLNIEAPELTLNGDYLPSAMVKYTPKQGSSIQGDTVQQAIDAADTLIAGVKTDYVAKAGLDADLSAHNNKITDLGDGVDDGDAVNMKQLKTKADVVTVTAINTQVTTNTQDISDIKLGTTKIQAENVTYTDPATGPLTGKSQVQESLDSVNTILQTTTADITALKNADNTFLTKIDGVLGSDLDANIQFTVKKLRDPQDDQEAATKNYVDVQIKAIQGSLSGQLQWAGTYDCTSSQIKTLSDAGQNVQGFQINQNLPVASAATNNYYFIVINKTPARPSIPAPQQDLSAGDWIIGDTTKWDAIEMAKAVTAANVSFTPTGALTGSDVQAALTQVEATLTATKNQLDNLTAGANKLPADNVSYTANQGGVITGATVQDALSNTDTILRTTQTLANTNKTDIATINNQIPGFAKLGSDNTFTARNTFNEVPQTTGDPTQPTDLITVQKVEEKIDAIKAVGVSFDPAQSGLDATVVDVQAALTKVSKAENIAFTSTSGITANKVGPALDDINSRLKTIVAKQVSSADVTMSKQLNVLKGANVQDVLALADKAIGDISDFVVENSNLVGTYDATNNVVLETFGIAASGKVVAGQALPTPEDENKSFLLIVKVAGTGANGAPAVPLASGDFIRSTGHGGSWEKVDAAPVKTATDITLSPITNLQAANVQEAVKVLFDKQTNITAADVAFTQTQTGAITGATVQDALASVEVTQTNQSQAITQIQNSLQSITAADVPYDNNTSNLPGTDIDNVQKAIEAVNTKFAGAISGITASTVPITNIAQLPNATNVQDALQTLSTKVISAAEVTFTATGEISATNVQDALAEVDSETVKLTGDQDVGGRKKFTSPITIPGHSGGSLLIQSTNDMMSYLLWRVRSTNTGRAWMGFPSTTSALENVFQFHIHSSGSTAQPSKFEFTRPIHYQTEAIQPTTNTALTPKKYVDDQITAVRSSTATTYLPQVNGVLGSNLDAGGNTVTNLKTPANDTDAVTKDYADNTFVNLTTDQNIAGTKTFDGAVHFSDTANFMRGIDMSGNKIAGLQTGIADGDAVNTKQLNDAIRDISGQLTGKLTYCGTYDAGNNVVATVSAAGQAHGFVATQALPADDPAIANCFLIVTVAGTGSGEAPAGALGVGDIILAQGGNGWLLIPIGSTRTASNVSVTAIQQLPNATNVQEALEQLAVKPAGASTAAQVTFTPVGGIAANNVQAALAEVDSETVKLAGNQNVSGTKTFSDPIVTTSPHGFQFYRDRGQEAAIEWFPSAGGTKFASLGFKLATDRNTFAFNFDSDPAGGRSMFVFNQIASYETDLVPQDNKDFTPKKYVDDSIATAGARYVTKVGGQLGGSLDANSQKITNLATPTVGGDAVNKTYVDTKAVLVDGQQQVRGRKQFVGGIDVYSGQAFAFRVDRGNPSFFEWWTVTNPRRYAFVGFYTGTYPNKNTFRFDLTDAGDSQNPTRFEFSHKISYVNANTPLTDPKDLVTKKYVDDAIAAGGGGGGAPSGLSVLSVSNVDITANFAGLTGKGTATISYRLLKDTAGSSILSALFGMKLTLTAPWTPTVSNTPTELVAAAHIPGQEYYNGLPIPVDSSLGVNDYKTVAQIHLYRAVRSARGDAIQTDAPIKIGRIVCTNDGAGAGTTKLAVVFSYNQPIPVPSGQGAFYVMRYEGLPALPI